MLQDGGKGLRMRSDRISSVFLMGFGIFFCYQSLRLGLGHVRDPGPGLIPFLSGMVLVGLSLCICIISIIKDQRSAGIGKGWQKGLWLVGSLLVYTFVLETLGFLVTTFLFLMVTLTSSKPRKLFGAFLVAFLTVTISYVVFSLWLKVQLPKGILGI